MILAVGIAARNLCSATRRRSRSKDIRKGERNIGEAIKAVKERSLATLDIPVPI
jgi:hypothetical protein